MEAASLVIIMTIYVVSVVVVTKIQSHCIAFFYLFSIIYIKH